MTIVYARYINRSFTVILFSQNKNFIYSVYRLSFSIFPAWQAQNYLNVHRTCTVAFVRNGIGLSIKLSLFYNFHSFVFIAKTSGLLTLLVHGSYPKSLRKNPDTRGDLNNQIYYRFIKWSISCDTSWTIGMWLNWRWSTVVSDKVT